MVYLGRPSRGCAVCRKRRIKCDETEPGCSYCLKKQIVCPGYKSQFDIAWRDQNVVTEKSVQRRKNAQEQLNRKGFTGHQLAKLSSTRLSVPKTIAQDYEEYAVSFFMSTYILLPKDLEVKRSFLDFLYPIWVQTPPTSPLKPAVAAVASCLLEAWSQMKPDMPLSFSRLQYLKGLAAMGKNLQTLYAGDDALMAALMLDMYENLQGFFASRPNNSPHISGSAVLAERRRYSPLAAEISQRVLLGARNHVIGRALTNNESVSPKISSWIEKAQDVPKTAAIELDELNISLANLQASASGFQSHTTIEDRIIQDVLNQAYDLDQRFVAWKTTIPCDWLPIRVSASDCISRSTQNAGLYQDYCDVYKDIFIAYTMNAYCSSRIKLQLFILTCLRHLHYFEDDYERVAFEAAVTIQEMADSMCASVPFHLGDRMEIGRIDDKSVQYPHIPGASVTNDHHSAAAAYGGWFLTTRIAELLAPGIPLRDGQREWIGRQMGRVRRIYSVKPT